MSTSSLLIIISVVLITAIFIIFPQARVLFKGFGNKFFQDITKTPEGATAVYEEAINLATEEYQRANNLYQKLTGRLNTAKEDLKRVSKNLETARKDCENFAANQKWDKVELYAEQIELLEQEKSSYEELVTSLINDVNEASEINSAKEKKLAQLKRDKKKTITEMMLNQQKKEIYDEMDELKSLNNTTNKLLASVKENAKDQKEMAVGAKAVHDSKTSTKLQRAEAEAKALRSNSIVEEMKRKYQK